MTDSWMKTGTLRHGLLVATILLVATNSLSPAATAAKRSETNVAADADTLAAIRSVVVMRFPDAFDFRVTDLNVNIGQGLIGAALDSADQKRMVELAARLKANVHGFSAQFADSIAEQLRAEGYEVLVQDGPWDKNPNGSYVLAEDRLPRESDSVLTIRLNFIGFAMGPTAAKRLLGTYQPWVTCEISLLRGQDRTLLYRQLHSGGLNLKGKEWKSTPLKKGYDSIPAIEQDFDGAVAALNDTANAVAASVREDLRRASR